MRHSAAEWLSKYTRRLLSTDRNMIRTAFELRLRRAHQLLLHNCVEEQEAGHFRVWSGTSADKIYDVTIRADAEGVSSTQCMIAQSIDPAEVGRECPDWHRMDLALEEYPMSPGISHVDYSPACKHVIAALMRSGRYKEINGYPVSP